MAQDIKLTLSTHLEDLGCSGQPIAEQGSRADVEVDNTAKSQSDGHGLMKDAVAEAMREMMKEIRDTRKEVVAMRDQMTEIGAELKGLRKEVQEPCKETTEEGASQNDVGNITKRRNDSAAQANKSHATEGQRSGPNLKRALASSPDAAQQATKKSRVSIGQTPSSDVDVEVEPGSSSQGSRAPGDSQVTGKAGSSDRESTASGPSAAAVELVWTPNSKKYKIWGFQSEKIKTDHLIVDGLMFGSLKGGPKVHTAVRFFAGDRFLGCYPQETGRNGLPTNAAFCCVSRFRLISEATPARAQIFTYQVKKNGKQKIYPDNDSHSFHLSAEDAQHIRYDPFVHLI